MTETTETAGVAEKSEIPPMTAAEELAACHQFIEQALRPALRAAAFDLKSIPLEITQEASVSAVVSVDGVLLLFPGRSEHGRVIWDKYRRQADWSLVHHGTEEFEGQAAIWVATTILAEHIVCEMERADGHLVSPPVAAGAVRASLS